MKSAVIFAHPWHGSFNKAVLDRVLQGLLAAGEAYTLIDLNKDGFDPVMSERDLALYHQGKSEDPLVHRYNQILSEAEKVILIFPIWWYDMPAILRGFFDKVMLSGSAYFEDERGIHPLRNIQKTILFTTSTAPTEAIQQDFGDPVNTTMTQGTFQAIGFHHVHWYNLGGIGSASDQERMAFLDRIDSLL